MKSLRPSLQFLQKKWCLSTACRGAANRPCCKHGLAGSQARLPGSETQGGTLEPEFLTSLPSGFYTSSSTKATGVYILYERTGEECILILSPSQDSEQRGHHASFSPQAPTFPSRPCSLLSSTQPRINPPIGYPSVTLISKTCHKNCSFLLT